MFLKVDRALNPEKLARMRSKREIKEQRRRISNALTELERNGLRVEFGIKEGYNPLLRLPVDMSQ